MNKVISLQEYKTKKIEQQYIRYYGNQKIVVKPVKKPRILTLVQNKQVADYDISEYIEEARKAGINIDELDIVKPDPTIPW